MKKILSIILGAFMCLQMFAQINVDAGYLNATYHANRNGYSYNMTGNGGFVGVGTDIALPSFNRLSFSPSLNFNIVDYNIDKGIDAVSYFLTAPLHIKYTYSLNRDASVFVSGGPTLVCTLGGQTNVKYGSFSYGEALEGGAFDLALGLKGGVVLSRALKAFLGYDFGLINQNGDSDYRITRNIFHVGIGYIF